MEEIPLTLEIPITLTFEEIGYIGLALLNMEITRPDVEERLIKKMNDACKVLVERVRPPEVKP